MGKKAATIAIVGWVCFMLAGGAVAQSGAGTEADRARDADREAIRRSTEAFVKAFNQGDARAAASGWTEGGEYYDDSGRVLRGRAAIEQAYADLFKEQPRPRIEVETHSIRFTSRDSAVEEGVVRLHPPGAELPTTSRYSVFHVREDGAWKIAVAREWGGNEEKLEDLAWLVGEWAATSKDREVRLSFAWNNQKTFLQNRFSVSEAGRVTASGMQEIGSDPHTGQIRSWMFDDDGGNGEVLWFRDGDRWVLETTGVTPDGIETTATNILTRLGDDKFTWRSIHRTVGPETVPDAPPMTVSRVKPGR